MVDDGPGSGASHDGSTSATFEHLVWPTTQPLDDAWWDSVSQCVPGGAAAGVRPTTEVVLYLRDDQWFAAARVQPPLSSSAYEDVVRGGLSLSAWTGTPVPPGDSFLQVQVSTHPDHLRRQATSRAGGALLAAVERLLEFVREVSGGGREVNEPGALDRLHQAIAACHLSSEPAQAAEFRAAAGDEVFSDDDLHVTRTPCRCGLPYLRVWRRLRGTSRQYLIPANDQEIADVSERVAAAPDYSDKWHAAEAALSQLAQQRPYIELTNADQAEDVPRWMAPGVPFAFTWPPS